MATIIELARKNVRKITRPGFQDREHLEIHIFKTVEFREPRVSPFAKVFERDGIFRGTTLMIRGDRNRDWKKYVEPKSSGMILL